MVKSETHQDLADEYVKAVDGKGTSLTGLCSTTVEDALWNGSSFIAMDVAVDGGRLYAYHLSGDNILGYRLDEDDRLIEIRIQEKAVVADGQWGEKEVSHVRVFQRGGDVVTRSGRSQEDLLHEMKHRGICVMISVLRITRIGCRWSWFSRE